MLTQSCLYVRADNISNECYVGLDREHGSQTGI